MTWFIAILLAAAAFAVAVFGFGLSRALWSSLLAALALGLAGYAIQASPNLPGAPVLSGGDDEGGQFWNVVDARKEMIGDATRSGSDKLLISDAFARRGQYDRAIEVLRSALQDDPQDFEAWLALGNSLIEHADGRLTPAALFALTRAASLEPRDPAPQYFVGISLIRQGRLMEARSVWAEAVAAAPEDAEGRAALEQRLARLDELLRQMSGRQEPPPAEAQ